MIKNEIKKILKIKPFCILIILIFSINIIHSLYTLVPLVNDLAYTGKQKIVNHIKEEVTNKKYQWLVNLNNDLQTKVNNGQYNTNKIDPNSFSGYIFADSQIVQEILDEYEYVINYQNNINNKIKTLKENIMYSQDKDWQNYNQTILNNLNNRSLSNYFDFTLLNTYLKNEFTFFLCLVTTIIICSYVYIYEKQTNTALYYYLIGDKIKKVFVTKLITSLLLSSLTCISLFISTFLCFYIFGMNQGLLQPIYSLIDFAYLPNNFSILIYLCLDIIYKLFGIFIFSSIASFVFIFLKKEYHGFFSGITLIYTSILTYNHHIFSPLNYTLLKENIFNHQTLFTNLITHTILICILNLITYYIFIGGKKYEKIT